MFFFSSCVRVCYCDHLATRVFLYGPTINTSKRNWWHFMAFIFTNAFIWLQQWDNHEIEYPIRKWFFIVMTSHEWMADEGDEEGNRKSEEGLDKKKRVPQTPWVIIIIKWNWIDSNFIYYNWIRINCPLAVCAVSLLHSTHILI